MTTETVMNSILEMVNSIHPEHLETFARDPFRAVMEINNSAGAHNPALYHMADLFTKAAAAEAPKRTKAAAVKACKGMFKYLKSVKREHMAGTWVNADGQQCAVDGFRAVRLGDHLPGLPAASQPWEGLDLTFREPMSYTRTVELPTAAEAVGVMALQRFRDPHAGRYCYDFGPGLPRVNAAYLLDMMTLFPDVREVRIADGDRCKISPMYWTNGNGSDGILLPVRKPAGEV